MSKTQSKSFRSYRGAVEYAKTLGNNAIVKVADLYIVTPCEAGALKSVEVSVVREDGHASHILGHVTLPHLVRLGNANQAKPTRRGPYHEAYRLPKWVAEQMHKGYVQSRED